MIRLFISILALVAIALAAWGVILIDHSYIIVLQPILLGEDRIELSAGFVGAVFGAALAISLLAGRIWQFFAALPGRIRERTAANRKESGYVALTKGLAAIAAGDAKESANLAKTSKSLLRDQTLTALLSAQSAQLQGKEDMATNEFKSLLENEETAFLGRRGLALQALRHGREAEALRHVKAAYALRPTAPWVLELLYRLELRDGNISANIDILERARKHGNLDLAQAKERLTPLYTQIAQDHLTQERPQEAIKSAKQALDLNPLYLPAALISAQALIDVGRLAQARAFIAKQWTKTPHPEFLSLYLEASEATNNPKKMRQAGLKLLKNNDGSKISQLALGEVMLRCLDLKAATPALVSAKQQGSTRAAALIDLLPRLSNILEGRDDEEEGKKSDGKDSASPQEHALALIEAALAPSQESEWACTNCGTSQSFWYFMCKSCEQAGTIQWQDRDQQQAVQPIKRRLERPRLLSELG